MADRIMVCGDCVMAIEFGDYSQLEHDLGWREACVRQSEIIRGIQRRGNLVVGDESDDFSWQPCECCESKLGGSRHEVFVV